MKRSRAGRGAQAVLAIGLLLHALFLVSLPTGILNGLFVEASQGHGQASDLFGIYQAGANLIHGHSIYDSADYRHEAPQVVPYRYFYRYSPPTAYVAGLAAVLLAPWAAYWLWVVLNELMMGALVWAVLRDRRWPVGRRTGAPSTSRTGARSTSRTDAPSTSRSGRRSSFSSSRASGNITM